MPYICKRSNSTGETQPSDLPSAVLGGCPPGWNQFLNKVGDGVRAPKGVRREDVNVRPTGGRTPGCLAASKSRVYSAASYLAPTPGCVLWKMT